MNVPITAQQIRMAAKNRPNEANMQSVLVSLEKYAVDVGLDRLHRLVHYLAQLMHESGAFKWDEEIWGPTPAQERYDIRTDLGNTPERDGDGKLYMGRTAGQLTGKSNYRQFRDWCRQQGYNPPDFVVKPDLVNTDPWEGLVPIFYWSTRKLNRAADQNDIESVTKIWNGGKNGLADRIEYYGRISLVVLGYGVSEAEVKRFQLESGLDNDGDVGPKTRAALHKRLVGLGGAQSEEVRAAPVVEEKIVETVVSVEVEKPVLPVAVEKEVTQKSNWLSGLFGGGFSIAGFGTWLSGGIDRETLLIVLTAGALGGAVFLIGGAWIVRRVKSIRKEIEA